MGYMGILVKYTQSHIRSTQGGLSLFDVICRPNPQEEERSNQELIYPEDAGLEWGDFKNTTLIHPKYYRIRDTILASL